MDLLDIIFSKCEILALYDDEEEFKSTSSKNNTQHFAAVVFRSVVGGRLKANSSILSVTSNDTPSAVSNESP